MHRAAPPLPVTASGCAPPMPPRPAGEGDRAGQRAAEVLVGDLGEGRVGALQDPLGADVDPGARPVIWPYIIRPWSSSSRKCSGVAHRGTSSELAISTRGAPSCVRTTPTGLPDCTSRVSSGAIVRSESTIASKASQDRAARPLPP
jgi:hypothetical protein